MKNLLAIGIVSIFLLSLAVPAATASYLNVTIYPDKGLANVKLNSEASLVFTYPAGGLISQKLNGTTLSYSFSENFTHPSDWAISFMESWLKSRYHNISVENMSLTFNLVMHANTTALVVTKFLTLNLWVTGIFNKTKSETKVNVSWRAFEVKGSFKVSHDGQDFDLNDMEDYLPGFLFNDFSEKMSGMGNVSTLNYTMFSKSLSSWQRTYDPNTNTTTFYYNASKYILFNAEWKISNSFMTGLNGNYSLKIEYDPSSTITTPGYATASGDTIVISPTAPSSTLPLIIGAAVAVIIVIGALAFFLRKRK
ncbi:MAG: hypothetical protein ACP5UG_02640 [Thermoplasmata archaeon]